MSAFVDALGLTFPILLDENASLNKVYAMLQAFKTAAYPQDWVIGTDGIIVYANNTFEVDEMIQAIERELD